MQLQPCSAIMLMSIYAQRRMPQGGCIMKRMIGIIAAIALLVAATVTPIDLSGIVVGPFLMLALGAGASWWAAFHVAEHTSDRETYAGILAGIAAGAGAVAGVLLMF